MGRLTKFQKMMTPSRRGVQERTAVVFGSGGARGWAHIGVLKAFREVGFKPDIVAGTSIGSIAAAVHAADALDAFLKFSKDIDWFKATQLFVEFGIHRAGLIEGRKVGEFLTSLIPVSNIEDLPMPYAAVATDLETAEEVVFRSGPLIEAIRASISMPGVFTPVPCGNSYLIDGGLVNPLPVNVVRAMGATRVVAININNNLKCGSVRHRAPKKPGTLSEAFHQHFLHFNWKDDGSGGDGGSEASGDPQEEGAERKAGHGGDPAADLHKMNLFDVFTRSLRIAEDKITIECIRNDPPDILIEPAVGDIATMDFSRAEDAIEAGYEATLAALGDGVD